MRTWAFLLVALASARAEAAFFSSAADPALTGALQSNLCGGTFQSFQHVYVLQVQGSGDSAVVTASMPQMSEGMYSSMYSDAGVQKCQLTLLGAPTTVTFDRPVQAVGLQLRLCTGTYVRVTAYGSARMDSTMVPCPVTTRPFVGVTGVGTIERVVLESDGFDIGIGDLRVRTGTPSAQASADLALTGPAPTQVARGVMHRLPLVLANAGPDAATGVSVLDFPPSGYQIVNTRPMWTPVGGQAQGFEWSVGGLASGASTNLELEVAIPAEFSCDAPFINIALPRATSNDPTLANNVLMSRVGLDRRTIPAREDCTSLADDDCDGRWNCVDSDCASAPNCVITPIYVHDNQPPPSYWPPLALPPPADSPLEELERWSDWRNPPMAPPNCYIQRHGMPEIAPQYCCNPQGSAPGVDWSRCVPLDPNALEALSPAVNGRGHGITKAGEVIRYRAHYENIGGADAHDVQVIVALDDDLDAATLAAPGGRYDAATRTITWVDPVVFPSDPRHFDFSIAVRADAGPATRVRVVATIVFPDAAPPTRLDTNFIEHAIPDPALPVAPDLAVFACERVAGAADTWKVKLENRGWAFAFDAEATVVEPPAWLQVMDGTASFGHPSDDRADLRTAPPVTALESSDTVELRGASSDPCPILKWQISYKTSVGEARMQVVQAALDADGDGMPDLVVGAGEDGKGCGCDAGGRGGASPLTVSLGLLLATALLVRRLRGRASRERS